MCRLLGYLGPLISLDQLMRGQPHSLYEQSYKPREMITGTVNVDGFGVGWYVPETDPTPARYVSTVPLWADENFASLGPKFRARCAVAAVRGATDGMPFGRENTPPFAYSRFLFAHNGFIQNFRSDVMRPLRSMLRDEYYTMIRGGTDSEHLFALWLEELARIGASDRDAMVSATRSMMNTISTLVREEHSSALLNFVATDGTNLIAARHAISRDAPSLYVRATESERFIVSEPLFQSDEWRAVAPSSVLIATHEHGIETHSL